MAKKTQLKAIDFFFCDGGITSGFRQAGIKVIAGIDIDPKCKEIYELNYKPAKFIEADIKSFTEAELIKKTKIKKDDDNLIFIGCPPCQYWSIIKTDKTKTKHSKNLLLPDASKSYALSAQDFSCPFNQNY